METINLNDYYPLIDVNQNIGLSNNGDTILCYQLDLPEIFTLSKEDYVNIHNFWYNTIKYLPKNSFVHKQDVFLKNSYAADNLPNKTFLQKATVRHFSGRDYLEHKSYLFIGNSKKTFLNSKGVSNPFKKNITKEAFLKELQTDKDFIEEVEKAVSLLNSSKYIKAYKLTEEEIHGLVSNHYNGYQYDKYVDTDLEAKVNFKTKDYNAIGVGDKRVGIYTINDIGQFPEYADIFKIDGDFSSKKFKIFKGLGDDFGFKLPFNHVYNQIIYIDDYSEHKRNLEKRKEHLYGTSGFNEENEEFAKNIGSYLKDLANDETKKIIRGHSNIIFYADSDEDFHKYSNIISTVYRSLDFLPKYPSKRVLKELYIKSLFAYSSTISPSNIYKTELQIALTKFTNITSYKSDEEGVFFTDRVFNLPVKRDIRDEDKKRIKAWNFFIFGPTGEGKSVLAQEIFRQLHEQGKRLVIFDIGASFKKLSYIVPKDKSIFFEYEQGKPIGLNPFFINTIEDLNSEKKNSLAEFCFGLWKPKEVMKNETKAAFGKMLDAYYNTVATQQSFPSFFNFIKKNAKALEEELHIKSSYFDMDSFIFVCETFVNGEYSFLFEQTEDISYQIQDKELIVFEFEQAQKDTILLTLLLQLANEAVNRVVLSDKSVDGIVFYDELAKFIKDDNIRRNVAYNYATNRKHSASIGTALQTPTQLPQGEDTDSMIENSQVLYILNNDDGYEPIVERFNLSEHQHNILKSITPNLQAKNRYTEFGLIIGKEIWVMRLELPKENYYTYQTDGKEYDAIMNIFNEHQNMELAIEQYIKQKK